MTLLEVVNKVLRRMREDEVGDLSSAQAQLIREFVSDIHAEVVEEHDWSTMDVDVEQQLTAGTRVYDLTGTTSQSFYRRWAGAQVFETSTDPQGNPLEVIHWDALTSMYQGDRDYTAEYPTYIAFRPNHATNRITMAVWPTPSSSAPVVRAKFHVPEEAVDENTDESYEFIAPSRPIYLGALYLALNERGEELGEPGGIVDNRYHKALAASREADIRFREGGNEYEFEVE